MIFRRISYRIALQFTTFVFLLLLINGALFIAVDYGNTRRQTQARMERNVQLITQLIASPNVDLHDALPPPLRQRVRVLDAARRPVYIGEVFADIPETEPDVNFAHRTIQGERFVIFTGTVRLGGHLIGFIQLAEGERASLGDVPLRGLLYFAVSVGISVLTFFVGLFFARRSLRPAEQMMERLEQFTQDASHELRTPLAALSSSLDLALRNKKYREGIESAKQDLKEVAALVERLLELARLDKFVLQAAPVDLSQLAEDTVAKYRPLAAEKNVEIRTNVVRGVTVHGDEALLRQVIGNLLSNAIRFSKPEGGVVTVRLTKHSLSVEDTGIGIAKGSLPQIFNRFYQADTSRAKEGYGLGLALVKRIVDLHGWTIGVQSNEGKGTTFSVSVRS